MNGDEPFPVEGDDVAGVVPVVERLFELARLGGVQIAQHDVGPGDDKPSPFGDPRDLLDDMFDAGKLSADGAGAAALPGDLDERRAEPLFEVRPGPLESL